MSSVTSPKSDQSQTLTAVLFMSLFVVTFVMVILVKDTVLSYACQSNVLKNICSSHSALLIDSESFTTSRISAACVDDHGLKISVVFGAPLTGEAYIQVFTTGEDVFPAAQGMSDSFETSTIIQEANTALDFVIPVESMPVGEQIFGNILTSQEKVMSSHVAYFLKVSDCSTANSSFPDPTLMTALADAPINYNTACLPSERLMVAFEFDEPVQGQFQALVAGVPYQLASVGNQPAILFFSGALPRSETALVRLVSVIDQSVVFEASYKPPVCNLGLEQ